MRYAEIDVMRLAVTFASVALAANWRETRPASLDLFVSCWYFVFGCPGL